MNDQAHAGIWIFVLGCMVMAFTSSDNVASWLLVVLGSLLIGMGTLVQLYTKDQLRARIESLNSRLCRR
jgi:hypothetical protein